MSKFILSVVLFLTIIIIPVKANDEMGNPLPIDTSSETDVATNNELSEADSLLDMDTVENKEEAPNSYDDTSVDDANKYSSGLSVGSDVLSDFDDDKLLDSAQPDFALNEKAVTEVTSWNDLKAMIESQDSTVEIIVKGIIDKDPSDERIVIPSNHTVNLIGDGATIVRPSTSSIGEFFVSDGAQLTFGGSFTIEAKNYDQGKGTLANANFVEVSEQGSLYIDGSLSAHTSDGFFNGKYGKKDLSIAKVV